MTTPEPLDNTVLALSPPRVPEATHPVIDADYGVPKHVYDLKPMGLKVDIDPPLAGTVKDGDVLALVLNGQSVASKPINPGEENAVNTLYIPKGLLLTNRLNELVYTFTRGSQNIGTSTPILTLLYNAIRPGIEDTTPGDGAHSELELILPPDVIEDGIDADRAKQGVRVCFSYPYCRAHDRIWLNCNGQDIYHTVTVAEAPAIPTAVPTTVCVMIDESVFEQAGDSPSFVFSYTVTDLPGNGPDTDSPFSASYLVDVHLRETRLVAPDMAEAPGDPNDDPTTIDRDKLGQNDLTVLVHTFAPKWQPNDKIRVTYTATPASGTVVTHIVEEDVARIPLVYSLMVPYAKVVAGSVARARYELIRNGAVIATSKTATADISGGGDLELLAPFLVKPAGYTIDPLDPLPTVRVEYLEAIAKDKARLVEVKAPEDSGRFPFPLIPLNQNKRANFPLSRAFLIARQGKSLEVCWNLNRDGKKVASSGPLALKIKATAAEDPRLPMQNISEANVADELHLNNFSGDASFKLHNSLLLEEGQSIDATLSNGAGAPLLILKNYRLTRDDAAIGLTWPISRQWLSNLPNDTKILLEAVLTLNNNSTTTSITLRNREYTLKLASFKASENFDSSPLVNFSYGSLYTLPSGITLEHLGGFMGLTNSHLMPGQYHTHLLGAVTLNILGTVRFTFPEPTSHVSFLIDSHQLQENNAVIYRDKTGNILGYAHLPYTNLFGSAYVIFSDPGNRIKSFELNNKNDMFLDTIEAK